MTKIDFCADDALAEEIEIPRRVELIEPLTGKPIIDVNGHPAFVTLYSANSNTFQERAFKTQAKSRQIQRKSGTELNYDMEKYYEAQIYADAFAGEWHVVKKNKADGTWHPIDAPCTRENAVNWVLANPLYRAQISAKTDNLQSFVDGEKENFTTPPSSRSSKASKTA